MTKNVYKFFQIEKNKNKNSLNKNSSGLDIIWN